MVGAASNCYCYCAQFTAKPGWKSCGDAGVLQGHGRLWSWDPAASGGTWESSRFLALAGAKNWPRGPEGPSFHGDIEDILHLWSLELVWARVSCRFLGCQLVVSSLILLPVISEVFQKLGPRPTLWAINIFFGKLLSIHHSEAVSQGSVRKEHAFGLESAGWAGVLEINWNCPSMSFMHFFGFGLLNKAGPFQTKCGIEVHKREDRSKLPDMNTKSVAHILGTWHT